MELTYYGHACFAVKIGGKHLLFDPFITPNPKAAHIRLDQVQADYILISHGHGDHLADAKALAERTGAQVLSNFEIIEWCGNQGFTNTLGMNHGGRYQLDVARLQYVNAIHSSVLPDGTYGGNPGGWIVESGQGNFYFSGDTALTYDMKLYGETHRLDFAVLCIGDHFTMGPEDAARAADFLGVKTVVGVHYDTFPPIVIDHDKAKGIFAAAGKILHLIPLGESVELAIS
jgi:L-ascorbate metabolism protein UlaG (beta-lactamase superfamily)